MKNRFAVRAIMAMTVVSGLWMLMPGGASATVVLNSATWAGNGHTYHLIAGGSSETPAGISWADADTYAVNTLGGHLATVDSAQLDTWIWNTFGNAANRNLWIGLTDNVSEGQFKWIATGAALSYAHWYPREPNNYQNEDYVFILKSGFVGGSGAGEGMWNDGQVGWTDFFSAPMYAIAETTAPEMDVQANSVSIVDGDATPSLTDHTDFGPALVTGRTVARTYTITNSGTATLNLTGSPIVVASGDFKVSSQPAASVAAGGTTTFQVTFDPTALGLRSGTLGIASDDADENPYDFSIRGEGTTPPEIQAPEMGSDGTVVIRWTSYANHVYTVHASTNLLNGFSPLESNIQATPSLNTYTDNVNGVSTKFWKVSTEE